MKKINQNLKNRIQLIIGMILIISGLIIYIIPQIKSYSKKEMENSKIEEYIKGVKIDSNNQVQTEEQENNVIHNKIDYLMILEIPKINFKKGLYNINSKYNKVDYGIEILKESDMPNKENSNLYLASHSGNSSISYFMYLNKLIIGDKVFVYYNGLKYEYIISNVYQKEKDGTIDVSSSTNNRIFLITCVDDKKQIIYTGILKNKEYY